MNKVEHFKWFLSHFRLDRLIDDTSAQCFCPAHDDKSASLSISVGDKGIILHCHAGCTAEDVVDSVNLKMSDLFWSKNVRKDAIPSWQKYIEFREKRKVDAVYSYISSDGGKAVFCRIRLKPKRFIYGTLSNGRFKYGLQGRHRRDIPAIYTPDWNALQKNDVIFYAEGEKDCETLHSHGMAPFTAGGASDWQPGFAELTRGKNLVICGDNDESGKRLVEQVKRDCADIAKKIIVIFPSSKPHGDITDFFDDGGDVGGLQEMINEAAGGAPKHALPKHNKPGICERLRNLNAIGYERSDKGAAKLFADVFGWCLRFNVDARCYYFYDGTRWIQDTGDMHARRCAKKFADGLLQYIANLSIEGQQREAFYKFCARFQNWRTLLLLLDAAKDEKFCRRSDFDTNPFLFNVRNGTLDLSGDVPKLLPHDAALMQSKIANVIYNPDATCPLWMQTVKSTLIEDQKIRYVSKLCGLSMTGDTSQESAYLYYGSTTRNGKSTAVETVGHMLGDYFLTIQPETLAQKNNRDARSASGDIARLDGARLVNASEPPKKMIFDTALLKTLTGRDTITARHLYEREFSFVPQFKLIINTNYLPQVFDDSVFRSNRLQVITFDKHFSPDEQDKQLKNKLREESELSGILNWCLEGLRMYREEGLIPPKSIVDATNEYRSQSDKIGNFIAECMDESSENCSGKDAYEAFEKWCSDNGYGCENKGNFFSELRSRGILKASGTVNGKTMRNIIPHHVLITDLSDDFFDSVDGVDIPFN